MASPEPSMPTSDPEYFNTLPIKNTNQNLLELERLDSISLLTKFYGPSYWKIETLTPTAWGGHIPFLFCLINLLRPRRYAELGTHCGASFFASCQATKEIGCDTKSVGVDLWEGDEHTGKYSESVFDDFKYLLDTRYSDYGSYLRMDFNQAVDLFDDESIDILHIDGLHTYDAVKNDFITWKNKVSKNGVILFHDTVVRENNFGVWQFWEEISPNYLSYEFKHTHGLGVIALGDEKNNPLIELLNLINSSPELTASFENHFERLGQLITFEAFMSLQTIPDKHDDPEPMIYGRLDRACDKFKRIVRKLLHVFQ